MSVRLEDVTVRYPNAPADALRGVSVGCGPGGVTLVTGRLGAGCSTLLLAIAGLAPHATGGSRSGAVTTLGHDPASPEGRAALAGRVGILFSTPWTQLSGMAYTVRDEVAFAPANLGWERGRIRDAVTRVLDLVDAAAVADRDPRTLSGGELQRVMLAAVLVMEPEVLLLDEPTLELDPENAARLCRLLPDLARQTTLIVASADLDRMVEVADRVVLLDRGELVADGAPAHVLGGERAVVTGCSTSIAEVARAAGCAPRYPLTVQVAMERFAE